jgi:hypothetical protein
MSNKLDIPGCEVRQRMTHGGVFLEDAISANGVTRVRTYRSGTELYVGNMLTNSPSNLEDPRWLTEMQNPICSSTPWRHRERKFQGWR